MMENFELEAQLKETLSNCANTIHAEDDLKMSIDFKLNNRPEKRRVSRKVIIGLAAAVCLTVGGALARGTVASLVSGTNVNDIRTTIEEVQKDAVKINSDIVIPSEISDYDFTEGNVSKVDKLDDHGTKLGSYSEIYVQYKKDGGGFTLTAREWDSEIVEDEKAPDETRAFGDVTVNYSKDSYIFVPVGYTPTAEEQQRADAGDLYISEGSSEREEAEFQNVNWRVGDIVYSIFTSDTSVEQQQMFDAAQELIQK